jgi:hypothetical protein
LGVGLSFTVREKVVNNKFANLTLICHGRLKQERERGSHGWEEALLQRGIGASAETEIMRRKERNGGDMRND